MVNRSEEDGVRGGNIDNDEDAPVRYRDTRGADVSGMAHLGSRRSL